MALAALALLVATMVALACAASAGASAGALDTTWSADGIVSFDATAATSSDEVTDLAAGSGGKVWVLSSMLQNNGLAGAALARLTSGGALDTIFSGDGVFQLSVGTGSYSPAAVLPRAGGGAFVVGTQNDPSAQPMPAIVAVTSSGALDTAWGSSGIVTWPSADPEGFVVADAALIGSDIVVAGWNLAGPSNDSDVRILTSDLTGAFGSGTRGTTALDVAETDHVTDIAAGASNTLLVTGYSSTASGPRSWALRLLSSGAPDTTWSSDGIAWLDLHDPGAIVASGSGGAAVAGRVTIAFGGGGGGTSDWPAVEQFTSAGAADAAFGDTGLATLSVPGSVNTAASGLELRADNGYFVAGTGMPSSGASSGDPSDSWWGVLDSTGNDTGARLMDLSGDHQSDGINVTLNGGGAGMLVGGHDDQGPSTGRDSLVARIQDFPPPTNTAVPGITGSSDVGSALTCANGTWTGSPTSYTYAWYADGVLIAGQTAAAHTIVETVGTVLTCRVTATNAGGSVSATSVGLSVTTPATGPANTTRPVITGATEAGATLSCSSGTWATTPTAYGYQWTANGAAIAGETVSTHIVSEAIGTQVRCVVTAYGATGSTSVASNPVTISQVAAPTMIDPPTITGTPEEGLPVTCETGTWSGNPWGFDYQWQADGVDIPFETQQTYVISVPAGTDLTCEVTANNDGGGGSMTSAPVTVTPLTAPVNMTPPQISGSTDVGSTLSCGGDTWSSSAGLTFQWKANGAALPGETATDYLITAVPGTLITCEVTATNTAGTASAESDPVTVTALVAPSNTTPPSISGNPVESNIVTCDPGTWAGSAVDSYTYQWYENGTAIGYAWDNWLNLVQGVGTVITCEVTAHNGAGQATSTSAPITITAMQVPLLIDPPTISGMSTDQGSDQTCSDGNWDYWPTSFNYQWNANGTPIPGANANTYTLVDAPGTSITCTVTAINYVGSSTPSTSTAIIVTTLLPPANTLLPSVWGSTDEGADLNCADGSWDSNPTSFTYEWTSDGTTVVGANLSTWTNTSTAGAQIRCIVTATNAAGSTSATSDPVTVTPAGSGGITVPQIAQPPIISGSDTPGSVISCSSGTWLGSPFAFAYQWEADGVAIPGETLTDHTIAEAPNVALTCRVTATNAAGNGDGVSAPLYVTSTSTTAPTNTTPPTITGASGAGATLTCAVGAWSGSPTSFAYEWTADGALIVGATSSTHVVTEAPGVQLRCTVTASNANGDTPATSSSVTVSATPAPANTALPVVTGGTQVGQTLSCSTGTWSNSPSSFAYRWTADGSTIPGATAATHVIAEAPGAQVLCEVTATNAGGSSPASSAAITVTAAPPTVPVNSVAPSISGTTTSGSTLTCANGTWSGAPTYSYQWTANGSNIGGATSSTYVIAQSVGTAISCVVTATNVAGSATATSAPVSVTAIAAPTNSALPSVSGGTTNGSTLTCTQGTWMGSPTGYAFQWTANGSNIGGATSSTYVISQAVGVVVRCVVTATNAGGSTAATSAGVTVTVTAPVNSVLPAITGTTTTGSTLTCSQGTWSNSPTGYAYQWTANGSNIGGANSSTYVIADAVGTALRCVVTATNAAGSSSATSTPTTVTAAPTPPSNSVLPAVSGLTTSGSTLTCSQGTWTGSPTGYTYQWTANGSNIGGATSSTYVIAQAVGTAIRCVVTATNAGGSTAATSSAVTVTAAPSPPGNTAVPTIAGATTSGSTLTCSQGTWTGSPTGYTYQWTANGSNIGGATSSTYVIADAVGTAIRCVVTATNAAGSANATSAATTVTVAAPTNTALPTVSGATTSGSALSCTTGSWTPAPTSYTYQWTANGSNIGGATSSTYVIGQAVGTAIRCVVTALNAGGSTSATSAATTVTVAAPANTAVPTVTGSTTTGSTLTCANGSWSNSPTGYAYQWTANGSNIASANSSTYVIADAVGTALRCVVTATNAGGSASATSAATTVTVGAPVNTAVPAISGSTTGGSMLSCTTGSWTPAATGYTYQWTANGSPMAGENASTYNIGQPVGIQIRCVVTASNAGGSGSATSAPVTVTAAPTPPANTAVPTVSGSTWAGSTLTCAPGAWTGSPTYAYQWTANGSNIGGATSSTYVIADAVGTALRCVVTGTNGAGSASATSAATAVTVAPPSNTAVPTVSGATTAGSTLSCTTGSWTPAPTGYTYQWTANGSNIGGATNSTYAIVETVGTTLRCVVTATTAGGSATATSAATTVTQALPANTVPPGVTGSTTAGSTLTCANGTWSNSPTSYTYQWTANGSNIGGATSASLVISQAVGTSLRCVVTATNAGGSTSATSNAVVVTLAVPSNTALPVLTGSTNPGGTLSCSNGSWNPAPSSYTYAWTANGSTISLATASTYTVVDPVGTQIRCIVTGTNAAGSGTATSGAVTVSTSPPPTNSAAPSILGSTMLGSTLTCNKGTWTNTPTAYAYAWTADGATIVGATSATYVTVETPGTLIRCEVTASNAGGAATVASAPLTVTPIPVPVNSTAPSLAGSASSGSTLTCFTGTWTNSPTSTTIAWTSNGVTIPGETGTSHVVVEPLGALIRCVVTAANGGGSASASSAPLTVTVMAPANSAAPSIGGSLTAGSVLTCAPGTWSGSPTLIYSWSSNGATLSGANAATHTISEAAGSSLRCTVTASNAGGTASATSAPVTVASASGGGSTGGGGTGGGGTGGGTLSATIAPWVSTLAGKPGGAYVGGIVRCNSGTWTSADPTFTYTWSINGALVAGAQSQQLTIPAGTATRQLVCNVTASASGMTAAATSTATTIAAYNLLTGSNNSRIEDNITGTSGNDRITLLAGRDIARGMSGDDYLDGGAGNDTLYGWIGNDMLYGGLGNDALWGGPGNDRLVGGPGADVLMGEGGNDYIDARDLSTTVDVIDCGPGRDTVLANRRDRVRNCETVRRTA